MDEGRNNIFKGVTGNIQAVKEVILDVSNTSTIVNLFKVHDTVEIREFYLETTEGSIVNLTGLYLDTYDGTLSVNITADGAVLSGAEVGSFVAKDKDVSEILTASINDQVRIIESIAEKETFQSFFITQKTATDTFIRLHYSTTEAPIDAKLKVYIQYHKTNGGFLEVV